MIRKLPQPQAGSKNFISAKPLLKGCQFSSAAALVLARPEPVELRSQIVEKQRPDHLQDVFLGGVVGTLGAPLGWLSITDWKSAPKMAGEMAAQSKRQASIRASTASPRQNR